MIDSVKSSRKNESLIEKFWGKKKSSISEKSEKLRHDGREITVEMLNALQSRLLDFDSRLSGLESKNYKSIMALGKSTDQHLKALSNMERRINKVDARIAKSEFALKKLKLKKIK